jgi:dipeptidyl-peptidase-3
MYQIPPLGLGPPSQLTQITYYPGYDGPSLQEDAALVSNIMDEILILPESTRLAKSSLSAKNRVLDTLQASVIESESICLTTNSSNSSGTTIRLVNGGHEDVLVSI